MKGCAPGRGGRGPASRGRGRGSERPAVTCGSAGRCSAPLGRRKSLAAVGAPHLEEEPRRSAHTHADTHTAPRSSLSRPEAPFPRPWRPPFLPSKSKMLLILLGVLLLHLLILVLLVVSTAASAWTVGGDSSTDLWYNCMSSRGGYHCRPASNEDWIQAVQALMILSLLFCLFSLVAFMYQLFKLVKGGRFFFTAIFQILASLFVMCGAIIYTVMNPHGADMRFGYAYVLAWVAFPLSLISGLIYIVLRKRE